MSDEREMLDDGSGQLIDGGPQRGELAEQEEGEDFEGHQLETNVLDDGSGMLDDGSGVVERSEDVV